MGTQLSVQFLCKPQNALKKNKFYLKMQELDPTNDILPLWSWGLEMCCFSLGVPR